MPAVSYLLLVLSALSICRFGFSSPENFSLAALDWEQPSDPFAGGTNLIQSQFAIARTLALNDINGNPNVLSNTTITLDIPPPSSIVLPAAAIATMINFNDQNKTLVIGNPFSFSTIETAAVGKVFGIAQLSATATSPDLSDKRLYPHFSRMSPASILEYKAIKDTILYYSDRQGAGWNEIAVISTSDTFGVQTSSEFITVSVSDLTILSYRQYLGALEGNSDLSAKDLTIELREVKESGARVIIPFVFEFWETFITSANETGLVGEEFVWFVPDIVVGLDFTSTSTKELSRGMIGFFQRIPEDVSSVQEFGEKWNSLDPVGYPGAGPDYHPPLLIRLQYDMMFAAGLAIHKVDSLGLLDSGERISADIWDEAIRSLDFDGASGHVSFNSDGDRISAIDVLYYQTERNEWLSSGLWSDSTGYVHSEDPIWYSNNSIIPDLDIREPFSYWSCDKGEKGFDKTGKEISLHSPDGDSDTNNISSHYHCDQFIDCYNISDETIDCGTNYLILYFVFGIITAFLMLIVILIGILVIVFGMILKYRRLRVSSPFFLLLILISILIGYSSIFAWYGKPHPVSCAFQPWLLGLPLISMIAALSAKIFRIWRIIRFSVRKIRISDLELFVIWLIAMVPAILILILWTIISTPTALMVERHGENHFVCATGGFTGEPGGIIFFSFFAAYGGFILLIGAIITILSRKIPSQFNESKLLAISIYNLGLLSIVMVPVYFIVNEYEPFVAWILRTLAILYAFTATLALQFIPKFFGIFIIDKGSNLTVFKSSLKMHSSPEGDFSTTNK